MPGTIYADLFMQMATLQKSRTTRRGDHRASSPICLPTAGTVLNGKTRGVNLFLRMEDETSHERLVQALNIKFSNLGWNTWATYARSTVPFTGQPTWLSGDARCRCRRCDYEDVSYPDWEPHYPRTSDQLPATNTPASVPMNVHSSTHAPVAVAYSSIKRPNPLSDDEGEETLQLHATETLETEDLVDWADLPPLEDLDASSSQAYLKYSE